VHRLFKTRSIVLNKKPWGENALLFSILTEDFGKIKVVAAGARKIKSKLSGHLQTLGTVELVFAFGKNFKKLIHACLIEKFEITDEFDFYCYSIILELLDKALPENEKNQRAFRLAVFSLDKILREKDIETKRFWLNFFIIKLMVYCGFALKGPNNAPTAQAVRKIVNADYRDFQIRKSENRQLFFSLRQQVEFCLEQEIKSLAGLVGE